MDSDVPLLCGIVTVVVSCSSSRILSSPFNDNISLVIKDVVIVH